MTAFIRHIDSIYRPTLKSYIKTLPNYTKITRLHKTAVHSLVKSDKTLRLTPVNEHSSTAGSK